MLVVKVVNKTIDGIETTYLFEADQPTYHWDRVSNYQEWCDVIKNNTGNYYIPAKFLLEQPKESDFTEMASYPFVVLHFHTDSGGTDKEAILFIQRASIFIMHEGKTVDTIYC